MATAARVHPGKRKANPMLHKTGKPRLGPLNLKQLSDLLEKTQVKKIKAKIQRELEKRNILAVKKQGFKVKKNQVSINENH
jgi:hypothetical protein